MKYELEKDRRKCKKVEDLIEKYSLDLKNYEDESLVMIERFDELIADIRKVYLSKTYLGLMSWLIDRAFNITNYQKGRQSIGKVNSNINKNKALLIKVLYSINKTNLLKIFLRTLNFVLTNSHIDGNIFSIQN